MYGPPRPMQIPMGMAMGGQNYNQQMAAGGSGMETVSLQVGPQGIKLAPGRSPASFRAPSATVMVSTSRERVHRGSISRPMSPMQMGYSQMSSGHGGQGQTTRGSIDQPGLAALASLLGSANIQVTTGLQGLQGLQQGQGRRESVREDTQSMRNYPISGQRTAVQGMTMSGGGGPPCMGHRTSSGTIFLTASMERVNIGGSRPRSHSPIRSASQSDMGSSITSSPRTVAEPKAPIVVSQPVGSTGLAPQMQQLLLNGIPGYTATVVLILMPGDEARLK